METFVAEKRETRVATSLVFILAFLLCLLTGFSSAVAQGNSAKFRQYDRAVKAQQTQLNKTIAAKRKCGFALSSKCRRISSSIRKMQSNLNKLKRARSRYANVARKKPNNKVALRQSSRSEKPRRRTLLEQIFGVKTVRNDGSSSKSDYEGEVKIRRSYNTVRTLCVRTCDGYYFPVSFSTTKDRLQSDLDQCQKMCPGTQTALFYHKMPSQDAEESISYRTGKPYSSLENAFSYRKAVNPNCSCKFSQEGFEEVAGAETKPIVSPKVKEDIVRIGLPVYREDPFQDPDTLENEAGGLSIASLTDLTVEKSESDKLAERNNSKIRIVGPAFFPVQ